MPTIFDASLGPNKQAEVRFGQQLLVIFTTAATVSLGRWLQARQVFNQKHHDAAVPIRASPSGSSPCQ
jgi:hypothetical protein